MQLCIDANVLWYFLIGMIYASWKQWLAWDYHKTNSAWTRFHHYFTEACFWPIDAIRLSIIYILA